MNDMTPDASASASKIKIGVRRSGRLDGDTGAECSLAGMESISLVSQTHNFAPEVFEAKCAALLEEKQVMLEQVVDRHDDMVRFLSPENHLFFRPKVVNY
jgi:hypothetical protein